MTRCVLQAIALTLLSMGCGGDGAGRDVPVSGRVSFEGRPAGGVALEFVPIGQTPGVGGGAVTGDDGSFDVRGRNSSRGLPPGEYAVTASRRRNADGSAADLKLSPIESPAIETLDPVFTDRERTPLRAKVTGPDPVVVEFTVTAASKK